MRAPAFWWEPPGVLAASLAPAAAVVAAVTRRRLGRVGTRAAVPVVCIGNMTVGGAGKTPSAIAVAARLVALGRRPGFLLRGYGGREAGPLRVDPGRHTAADVGDEALLLARHAPTAVARERPPGAALLARSGVDVIVMDDGMQNPSLLKDLTITVVDGERGHGNGLGLPAGPLRLPEADSWRLADAVLIVGPGAPGEAVRARAEANGKPILLGRLAPDPIAAAALRSRRVLAFAGIGRPSKFFDTVREVGADLVAARPFPDHHPFTAAAIDRLLAQAKALGAIPVTTEKDAVRLHEFVRTDPSLAAVTTLPVNLHTDPVALDRLLAAHLT